MFSVMRSYKLDGGMGGVRVTSSEGVDTAAEVYVTQEGDQLNVVLSCGSLLSRIKAPHEVILGLRTFAPKTKDMIIHTTGPVDVDGDASFTEAYRLLHVMHKEGALDTQALNEHTGMISFYKASVDVEALRTYFHLENLVDIANKFVVPQYSGLEVSIWRAVWPKVLQITKGLGK